MLFYQSLLQVGNNTSYFSQLSVSSHGIPIILRMDTIVQDLFHYSCSPTVFGYYTGNMILRLLLRLIEEFLGLFLLYGFLGSMALCVALWLLCIALWLLALWLLCIALWLLALWLLWIMLSLLVL